MTNTVEINQLSKMYHFENQVFNALSCISLAIKKGEFVAIMGASGSGKSTLLNLIATIDAASSGSILIEGESINSMTDTEQAAFRRQHLSFIFQDYNLLDNLTLHENIALALTVKKISKELINDLVVETATTLGIEESLSKYPHQVSGGQRQRCACARALAVKPDLILADEPTGALDSHSAANLLMSLKKMNQKSRTTILMVTHDALSASYCDRILFMKDGELISELLPKNSDRKSFFLAILDKTADIMGVDCDVS